MGRDTFPLDHVAQSLIQPGFEHIQAWGILSFFVQPVPVSHYTHSKEFLPNLNRTSFSLKLLPLVLSVPLLIIFPAGFLYCVPVLQENTTGGA